MKNKDELKYYASYTGLGEFMDFSLFSQQEYLESLKELELEEPVSLDRFKSSVKEFENFTKAKQWLLSKARADLRKVRWINYKIIRLKKRK